MRMSEYREADGPQRFGGQKVQRKARKMRWEEEIFMFVKRANFG